MANINLSGTIHHEAQSKVITDRIFLLEQCMGNLCETFGKIARKNARLRDASDIMVTVINEYSGKENINTSTKKGLVNYSSYLSSVEDYRNAMIERVEKSIIQPISKYHEYLKTTKKSIKSTITVRDKESQKQKKLNELMQRQPNNGRNIAQAEADAEGASQRVATQDRILAEEIDKLEQKKLEDMKKIFKEYAHIQMIFHAKALEMLTTAYKEVLNIDIQNDLEEFRNAFTQASITNFNQSSKMSLNSSSIYNQRYNAMFNQPTGAGGGQRRDQNIASSLPNSPRRGQRPPEWNNGNNNNNNNLTAGGGGSYQKRAVSNDNIPNAMRQQQQQQQQAGGVGSGQQIIQNNNNNNNNMNRNYNSEPDLNDMQLEDLSDDSDAER